MFFKFNNLGMVKEANIEFNGLTVIAGENDTGKSTIGKLLFSVIKSFSRYEQDLKEDKRKNIISLIDRIYFSIRRNIHFQENIELRSQFNSREFFNEVQSIKDSSDKTIIDSLFKNKLDIVNSLEMSLSNKERIIHDLESLKEVILWDDRKENIIKRALSKAFVSEFYFEITNKATNEIGHMSCMEGENSIFDVKIKNNKISDLKFFDTLYFNDVTYIETPIILQLYDVISRSSTLFEMNDASEKSVRVSSMSYPKVPLHMKDLLSKLENANYITDSLFELEKDPLRDEISNLINGNITFKKEERDFIFSKRITTSSKENESFDVKSVNVATGIKAFGIIQLLINSKILDDRSLLIIDEPEIHLHPMWQVEYAKIIISLIKNDISVLITTHSPYIIQALKYYGDKEKISEKVNFYLAEKIEGSNMRK